MHPAFDPALEQQAYGFCAWGSCFSPNNPEPKNKVMMHADTSPQKPPPPRKALRPHPTRHNPPSTPQTMTEAGLLAILACAFKRCAPPPGIMWLCLP